MNKFLIKKKVILNFISLTAAVCGFYFLSINIAEKVKNLKTNDSTCTQEKQREIASSQKALTQNKTLNLKKSTSQSLKDKNNKHLSRRPQQVKSNESFNALTIAGARISKKLTTRTPSFVKNVDYIDNSLKIVQIKNFKNSYGKVLANDGKYIYFEPAENINTNDFLTAVYREGSPVPGRATGLVGIKFKNNNQESEEGIYTETETIAHDLSLTLAYQIPHLHWAYFKHQQNLGLSETAKILKNHPLVEKVKLEANFGWLEVK